MSNDTSRPMAGPSHSIDGFCQLEGISRAMFYKLKAQAKPLGFSTSVILPNQRAGPGTEWRQRLLAETPDIEATAKITGHSVGGAK